MRLPLVGGASVEEEDVVVVVVMGRSRCHWAVRCTL